MSMSVHIQSSLWEHAAKPTVKYKEHISINWQNASQKIASAKIKKSEWIN